MNTGPQDNNLNVRPCMHYPCSFQAVVGDRGARRRAILTARATHDQYPTKKGRLYFFVLPSAQLLIVHHRSERRLVNRLSSARSVFLFASFTPSFGMRRPGRLRASRDPHRARHACAQAPRTSRTLRPARIPRAAYLALPVSLSWSRREYWNLWTSLRSH